MGNCTSKPSVNNSRSENDNPKSKQDVSLSTDNPNRTSQISTGYSSTTQGKSSRLKQTSSFTSHSSSRVPRDFPTTEDEQRWVRLYQTYSPHIIDPADVHSVLDSCISDTINQLKSAETTLILRRARKIVRSLLNSSSNSNNSLTNHSSTVSWNRGVSKKRNGDNGKNNGLHHPSSKTYDDAKSIADDNKSRLIYQKGGMLDEHLMRKIFVAGCRCLIVGVQTDRVQNSLDSYLEERPDNAESIWNELLSCHDRTHNISPNKSPNLTSRRHKKTNTTTSVSYVLDPIKSAFILLLHISESRWDYIASIASFSAKKAGLILDVNKQDNNAKSKPASSSPPPPFKINSKESDKLPLMPPLPSGIDFRSLCFIIALALYSSRRKRLVLLFYLLMDPKQLAKVLNNHPNGGIPSWLFEADSTQIISFSTLSHYYYFGGSPCEEIKRSDKPNIIHPNELKVKILSVIETIATLLYYDAPDEKQSSKDLEVKDHSLSGSSPKVPSIISENQTRQRALSFGDKKYRSAKMHVMLAEYLHNVRKSGTIPVFENNAEQKNRSQYMDIFWDASHKLYLNLQNKQQDVRDSWTFDEFMLWVNTALPDDSALDIVMNQIFGMGLLPTPSMERNLVSQSWIEWQLGEPHLFYDGYMNNPLSAVTQGIKSLFRFSTNDNSEYSSSNSHSLESSMHTSTDLVGESPAWGGIGGYDGRGALGNGVLYCIEKEWWENWMRYVKWEWNDASVTHSKRRWKRPHELSNEKLLDRESESYVHGALGSYEIMKKSIKKDIDYVLIPPGVWNILYELYGGGPPLPRMIINKFSSGSGEVKNIVDYDLKKYLLEKPSRLPTVLNVVTHPWVLDCHVCDPQQPYRRGDVGSISIRIMTIPDQPLWRLLSEIVARLPVVHPRGKDYQGVGRGRLWKKVNTNDFNEDKERIRYGPWSLLCKKGFTCFPVSDINNNSGTFYKENWEEYTSNKTVGSVGLNDGNQLMFEYALFGRSDEKISWPREAAAEAGKLQQTAEKEASFRQMLRGLDSTGKMVPDTSKLVGKLIDALDPSGRWYQAEITDVKNDGSTSDSDDMSDDSNYSDEFKNDEKTSSSEVRAIRVDFSDVGGHEEWIDVNSDRLAIAGRFTRDSMKSMENLEVANGNSNGVSKTRSLVLKKHPANESSTFQIDRQLCSFPGFGACGLTNLGNTCYANAAIQCISCLPLIRSYLVSGQYKHFDINRDNPLGTGGKLLEEFAELLKVVWSGKYGIRSPTRFRFTLGRARQQYSAADQQDAQEFLNDMLDTLHEDSNKVIRKPYVEAVEDNWVNKTHLTRVGEETWRRFLRRNRSIIVNTSMGQVLNRVTCPKCSHTSHNFDPFNMLSVPFPTTAEVFFRCQVIRRASAVNCSKILGLPSQSKTELYNSYNISSPPSKQLIIEEYIISISRLSDVSDLKAHVENRCGISVDRFKLCSVDVTDNNAHLHPKDPRRLFMNVKALPEKDGPCLQLLKGPLSGNQTVLQSSSTTIIAFETTINSRPNLKDGGRRANEDEKIANLNVIGAISRCLEMYGDEMECRLYDTDPLPLSKAISRRLWPRTSADFKLGLRVDAIDQRQQWFPGTVIEIIKGDAASTETKKTRVKIHFDNFSTKWDLVYSIDNFEKGKLQPLYSHSQPKETPVDLLVHHRYGDKVASLFGQTFFVQCHVEWSTARAGAHILAQAGRFLECVQERNPSHSLRKQEGKLFQDAWSALTTLIDFLIEADRKYVTSAFGDGNPDTEFDDYEHTATYFDTLDRLLPLLPFEILICGIPPQLKKENRSNEVPFAYSLVRTIGNYFNARQVLVIQWKELNVPTSSQQKDFIMYTSPFKSKHQRSFALLRKHPNKEANDEDSPYKFYPGIPLGSCLDEFCKEQQLGNSEGWRCPRCKEVREGRQSMTVWRLPDLLTFHLKRFNCSARWREKITTKVNFPLTGLNMKKWCDMESPVFQGSDETYIYDLVGVVNHFGGMTGGHYVATCKATACTPDGSEEVEHNFNGAGVHAFGAQVESVQGWGWKLGRGKEKDAVNGKTSVSESQSKAVADSSEPLWLQFDDDSVEPILPRDVVSDTAYVLFYRRRQISPNNISRYSTPS